MSDKPREFWFSRKRVDIGASPVQTDYYNTRFYPQNDYIRLWDGADHYTGRYAL